jgi:hypothetical protein
MVWYGMVWYNVNDVCGMVWYGMVWYGVVLFVMVLYVWYGLAWYDSMLYRMTWYGIFQGINAFLSREISLPFVF